MLYVSNNNPGGAEAVRALVATLNERLATAKGKGGFVVEVETRPPEHAIAQASELGAAADAEAGTGTATHMLLYLSKDTFVGSEGDRLADEVRALRAAEVPVLLLHEKNSCEFGTFFQTTPQDLIADGLYKMVALELLPAPHDAVSAVHLAKAVGAKSGRGPRGGTSKGGLQKMQNMKGGSMKVLPQPVASSITTDDAPPSEEVTPPPPVEETPNSSTVADAPEYDDDVLEPPVPQNP